MDNRANMSRLSMTFKTLNTVVHKISIKIFCGNYFFYSQTVAVGEKKH